MYELRKRVKKFTGIRPALMVFFLVNEVFIFLLCTEPVPLGYMMINDFSWERKKIDAEIV